MDSIVYSNEFKEGNYLWDKDNGCLVEYHESNSIAVKGSTDNSRVNTVFPIPINEELLRDVLGFSCDNKCGYSLDEIQIDFCGEAPYGTPYLFRSKTSRYLRYLNDIQNACIDDKKHLTIDKDKLFNYLSSAKK